MALDEERGVAAIYVREPWTQEAAPGGRQLGPKNWPLRWGRLLCINGSPKKNLSQASLSQCLWGLSYSAGFSPVIIIFAGRGYEAVVPCWSLAQLTLTLQFSLHWWWLSLHTHDHITTVNKPLHTQVPIREGTVCMQQSAVSSSTWHSGVTTINVLTLVVVEWGRRGDKARGKPRGKDGKKGKGWKPARRDSALQSDSLTASHSWLSAALRIIWWCVLLTGQLTGESALHEICEETQCLSFWLGCQSQWECFYGHDVLTLDATTCWSCCSLFRLESILAPPAAAHFQACRPAPVLEKFLFSFAPWPN